ncbi:uncharacterized protein LOC112563082 isoform X2 [Pomacea canaliculata]|uniref:uncharacterized protein LOC112563082 isoform X2 n=1 Tax=Pomacea canaliculata TaxID=400727 RepID=UPI000D730BA4|nr:uncharacterized protein LOC112563082 isoform X2 [Pomacea canaliculata]
MTSCVDADVDDNIAFPVGTVICSRASTTTVPTIETSADSFEQVTTPEQILEQLSAVYNLDNIRQQCNEFHACTVELYKSENLHRILAGDNIQLRNICGLMYRNNNNSSYRILEQQCSTQERESIKGLLEEKLSSVFDDPSEGEGTETWLKLKTCLDGAPDDDQYINKLCRLKGNSTAPLCNQPDVQKTTETFFNAKLRELHCQCDAVINTPAPSLPLRALIGGACGGALILILLVIIIVLCVRHRKLRRRLKTESKRSGNKTSPTDSSWLSNQGIRNHSQAPEARVMRDSPGINLPPRHRGYPSVTSHYQHPAPASPSDSNYIELLPDVACIYRQQGLPGDRGHGLVSNHPRDRPYDLAKNVAPSPATERRMRMECPSGRYDRPLETIDMKSMGKSKPQGGYNHLGLQRGTPEVGKRSQPLTRQVAESEDAGERNCSNEHSYFEVEPTDTTKV